MSECVIRMDHIPRNCLECPLNGQCGTFADWACTLNSPARKHYPQPFDKGCNILAVLSEPHGRLVDADAFEKDVSDALVYGLKEIPSEEGKQVFHVLMQEVLDNVKKRKTIVPAERSKA